MYYNTNIKLEYYYEHIQYTLKHNTGTASYYNTNIKVQYYSHRAMLLTQEENSPFIRPDVSFLSLVN